MIATRSSIARTIFAGLAITAIPFVVSSCASNNSENATDATAAMLKAQADQWDQAIIRKDLEATSANMSGDFRHIDKTGAISDRATFLQEIISPDLVIDPYTVEDFDIRIYGDCALLCGRTRMTGTYKGMPFQSHYRYVDTYTRSNGQWKVCNVQITAIPE